MSLPPERVPAGIPESGCAAAPSAADLAGALRWRARSEPQCVAFRYLADGESEESSLSYAELDAAAARIAAELRAGGAAGEPVLLLHPHGLDFIAAFFGCLYAGAIAVPAAPPRRRQRQRLHALLQSADPRLVLAHPALVRELERESDFAGRAWLASDARGPLRAGGSPAPVEDPAPAAAAPEQPAFLQYTSGSTGDAKGVIVTHAALGENLRALDAAFAHPHGEPLVSWLPLYHDMGLIAVVLLGVYTGSPAVLMPPVRFIERPIRWLRAISSYGAASSGAPNFAYDLCVHKTSESERAGLELGRWSLAYNGAEPIFADTLERFARAFAPHGFRREALYPCYGMAESCLIIAGGTRGAPPQLETFDTEALERGRAQPLAAAAAPAVPAGGRQLVGCGRARAAQLRIVDPETRRAAPPGGIGEIWVRSPSVCAGYWRRESESEAIFRAQLEGEPGPRFLRTGDLGFVQGEQLFITGRCKDVVIVRGRNCAPQDLERCVEQGVAGVCAGGCIAFAPQLADAEPLARPESLIVVCEVERSALRGDRDALLRAVRGALAEAFELEPDRVLLVKPGALPRTSSGKRRRAETRARWRAGALDVIAQSRAALAAAPGGAMAGAAAERVLAAEPPAEREDRVLGFLQAQIAELTGGAPGSTVLPPAATPVECGLGSLGAVELAQRLRAQLGQSVDALELLGERSLRELAAWLAELAPGEPALARPAPAPPREAPLSRGQRAVWAVHQREPDSVSYNLHLRLELASEVDAAALERALLELVARHPSLRTAYVVRGDEPRARLRESAALEFEQELVADAAAQEAAIVEQIRRPFELGEGVLLRARLLSRGREQHTLLLVSHHIALDFGSVAVLLRELRQLYADLCAGREPALPAPRAHYAQFAAEQEAQLAARGEELARYWERELGGELPSLALPLDHPRSAGRELRGASETLWLGAQTAQALRALARSSGVTLFTLLMALFAVLLHRYTQQRDLVIGTPSTGRADARYRDVVGYFANPLALRLHPDPQLSFRAFLAQVRERVRGALAHGAYPFQALVERLRPARDADLWPLYQVAFTLQEAQLPEDAELAPLALGDHPLELRWGALRVRSARWVERVENFDLKLVIAPADGGLLASFQYNRALFEPQTARRWARHFAALARAAAADPGCALGALPLFGADERAALLADGAPARPAAPYEPVLRRFEQWVQRAPDAPAVSDAERQWSYAELDAAARWLARVLRAQGVREEVRVGISLPRSAVFVAAALGIWKAGGVYLPIAPGTPPARTAALLRDAGALLLVTREAQRAELPADVRTLCLDDLLPGAAQSAAVAALAPEPACGPHPQALAYAIHTSGSSGAPKAVEVPHGALANLVAWHCAEYALGPADRVSQLANLGFDASVWEIWPPLAAGASLHIAPEECLGDPRALLGWMEAARLSLAFLPTPLAELALGSPWPAGLRLRALLTGGDRLRALPAAPPQPGLCLRNHYGPTEAAVVSTAGDAAFGAPGLPDIGRPIDGLRALLLDARGELVPQGALGELCIGGIGLARGYAGQPGRTAERFVPDPHGGEPGARLYRSGDWAHRRPGGALAFAGRRDTQVKLRGQRIELGEVEAALAQLPDVRAAAAALREDPQGRPRLVGYVVLEPGRAGAQPAARGERALRERWAALYDETYAPAGRERDPDFDIVGWNSSYDERPLPAAQMREWAERTAQQILEHKPRCVWEIGCGTGLLLLRIAPHCARYHGSDFSRAALDALGERVGQAGLVGPVSLELGAADEAPRALQLPAGLALDTVILNSVAQYFPSLEYLERVLEAALARLECGRIFVGDVRDRALLEVFHADVQRAQAAPARPARELWPRALARAQRDAELCVDARFFHDFAARHAAIRAVEVRPKPGAYDNELSRFRYDVVLHVGAGAAPARVPAWTPFAELGSLAELEARLAREAPELWGLSDVPDARSGPALRAAARLRALAAGAGRGPSVAELEAELARAPEPGVWPEELLQRAARAGYRAELRRARAAAPGRFDAVLRRASGSGVGVPLAAREAEEAGGDAAAPLASEPLRAQRLGQCLAGAQRALAERLPAHLLPELWVALDALPLTARGKLDRAALPAPEWGAAGGAGRPARSALEAQLAAIWSQLLGVPRVGMDDGFFALGGDSISALALVSRLRELGIELRTRAVFEAQTVARLAAWIEARRAASAPSARDAGHPSAAAADAAAPPPGALEYALSPLQQGLFFHGVYAARGEGAGAQAEPVYVEQLCVELSGSLDPRALKRATQQLIDRHEALRTAVVWRAGEAPHARVAPAGGAPLDLALEDWTDAAQAPASGVGERAAVAGEAERLGAWLQADRARPLAWERAPALRLALIRSATERWHWVWTFPHFLLDGWSLALALREVMGAYAALAAGAAAPEPPAAPASREVLRAGEREGPDPDASRAFWSAQRAAFAAAESLADPLLPRGVRSGGARRISLTWDGARSAAARAAARSAAVSLHTLLQAAFALALSRAARSERIALGVVASGRDAPVPGAERALGLLIQTLPLALRVPGRSSAASWLPEIQRATALAQEHAAVGLAQIQAWLERDPREPLFDALLALESYPREGVLGERFAGVRVQRAEHRGDTHYPLTLVVTPDEGLRFELTYRRERFTARFAERLLVGVCGALDALVAQPRAALDALDPFAAARAAAALPRVAPPASAELGDLAARFERAARSTPDAPALVWEKEQWSYGELARAANRLAHALRRRGVGAEGRVALLLEPGPRQLQAILGVLAAGASYVPLDPALPAARLQRIVDDVRPECLLTSGSLPVAAALRAPRLELDRAAAELEQLPDTPPVRRTHPDQLAYVIFTSGSTGVPKGVAVSHANVLALLAGCAREFAFTPRDVFSAVHSYAFDVSVFEFFAALLHGGRVVGVPPRVARDPRAFARLLREQRVTVLSQTPSAFYPLQPALLEDAAAEPPLALRLVIFAGEALEPGRLAPWFARRGEQGTRFINMYGITETTVHLSVREVSRADTTSGHSCVGGPLPGVDLHVLDDAGHPLPPALEGELFAGGGTVARGYWRRPALTAQRFVPDALSGVPGARLYRSGDLAARGEDGELMYCGRRDRQVQLRGLRIELGEVEVALCRQPGVVEAAACVQARDPSSAEAGSALVAYAVAAPGAALDPEQLRAALREELPEYMVPARIALCASLPRTPNQKLDRAALQRIDFASGACALPESARERQLAQIWREVLRVERVARDDDFFRLGGDSIASMQVVSRARAAGLRLEPRDLFEHPTLRALAARLEALGAALPPAPPLARRAEPEGSFPLTPIQHWLAQRALAAPAQFNQALWLELPEPTEPAVLRAALARLAAWHPALRLRPGAAEQRCAPPGEGDWPLESLELHALAPAQRVHALRERAARAQASLDLARGPLACALHVRGAGAAEGLLLAVHHWAVDAVSWRILLDDLAAACAQLAAGRAPQPAAPATHAASSSYADWARRLEAHARGALASAELAYWAQQPWAQAAQVRLDDPAASALERDAHTFWVRLEPQASAQLAAACGALGARLEELLLCALARACGAELGGGWLQLDLESHGREELFGDCDVSHTVGWFTALYPVRLPLAAADPGEHVQAVAQVLRAVPNRGVGYGALRYLGEPEARRALQSVPPSALCFNFLGRFAPEFARRSPVLGSAAPAALAATAAAHAGENRRAYELECNASWVGEQLVAQWSHTARLRPQRVGALAERWLQALRELASEAAARGPGELAPGDFELADGLDPAGLDAVLAQLARARAQGES